MSEKPMAEILAGKRFSGSGRRQQLVQVTAGPLGPVQLVQLLPPLGRCRFPTGRRRVSIVLRNPPQAPTTILIRSEEN